MAAPAVDKLATIKDLREKSGAPIVEVKSALEEGKWNMGKCLIWHYDTR